MAALDDDLDLPTALAIVREMLRADLPADERRWLVLDADAVLGLDLHRVWDAVPDGRAQGRLGAARERDAARAARDFARADALRDEIEGWAGTSSRSSTAPDGSTAAGRGCAGHRSRPEVGPDFASYRSSIGRLAGQVPHASSSVAPPASVNSGCPPERGVITAGGPARCTA